jgi:hypothetical protein
MQERERTATNVAPSNLFQNWRTHLGAFLLAITALVIFLFSPVRQVNDSKFSMLVSQGLIQHRSFALDHYSIPRLAPVYREEYVQNGELYQLEQVNNHIFYFFPPGSSVLSVPFVTLMNAFGISAAHPDGTYDSEGEKTIEGYLAALLMAALIAVFFYTSSLAHGFGTSAIIALGAAFGTQVWSTASRAMYTDTWALLLLGIIILMLAANEINKRPFNSILLASLMSWMYFVYPLYAVHVIGVSIYVLLYHRQQFIKFAVTGLAWFSGLILYSWHYFGQMLPNYFKGGRLGFSQFWEALPGNLISPSRGLLVFVPVIFFVAYLLIRYRANLCNRRLVILAISLVTGHLVVVSGFAHWWGGHSFGPRFTTGTIPWIVLLAILGLAAMSKSRVRQAGTERLKQRLALSIGAILLAASVFTNARGALSPETLAWNSKPLNVDEHPERLWSWQYPQFLAGLLHPPLPASFPALPKEALIDFGSEQSEEYLWFGWSGREDNFRWTDGKKAAFIFRVTEPKPVALRISMGAFLSKPALEKQSVQIDLNGKPIAGIDISDDQTRVYIVALPDSLLKENNVLTFGMPDAASPESLHQGADNRLLGLRVEWLRFGVVPPQPPQ